MMEEQVKNSDCDPRIENLSFSFGPEGKLALRIAECSFYADR